MCTCLFYRAAPAHHDMLRLMEVAPLDAITGLVEMAVTWHELEYSELDVIPPESWLDFVEAHVWQSPDRIIDLVISLQSIVGRSRPTQLAPVLPLRGSIEVAVAVGN